MFVTHVPFKLVFKSVLQQWVVFARYYKGKPCINVIITLLVDGFVMG